MKIAVLGIGSIGLVAGVLMTRAGYDVTLIDSWPDNVKALHERGGKIIGALNVSTPVKAVDYDNISGMFDLVVLATKQRQVREAMERIKPHLAPDFSIVCMCNGICEDLLCELFGKEHIIGCSVNFPATLIEPGITELTSNFKALPHVYGLGECSGAPTERTYRVAKVLESVGPIELTDNIWGLKWTKIMHNSAWSGMSVCLGTTMGNVSFQDESCAAACYILLETAKVMEGLGITPVPLPVDQFVPTVDALSFSSKSELYAKFPALREKRKGNHAHASMLQDIVSGRIPTEVDQINGKVVEGGKKCNVPTPFNEKVVEIVHRIERGELQPCWNNIKLFNFPRLVDTAG